MNIVFEYQNITASERLEQHVEDSLNNLSKKYPFVIRGDVFFKKENKTGNTGHQCSIRLSAPGPRLFSSSDTTSFESSISECIRELNKQLEKRKSEMQQH
ncbi:ribosome-associated translation inhibitor RaiA [uncultured Dokdonia sp.]|uniref:ribosome hibernation-promoting factor, HPF/YfiA family n=1 Tax=uncultured Dokdonia sp. TaxID=575653 RepID=UPI0026285742|nr:ribosome-associated translation inhibitor RaiA [uncultured Dokdonia sp.]